MKNCVFIRYTWQFYGSRLTERARQKDQLRQLQHSRNRLETWGLIDRTQNVRENKDDISS